MRIISFSSYEHQRRDFFSVQETSRKMQENSCNDLSKSYWMIMTQLESSANKLSVYYWINGLKAALWVRLHMAVWIYSANYIYVLIYTLVSTNLNLPMPSRGISRGPHLFSLRVHWKHFHYLLLCHSSLSTKVPSPSPSQLLHFSPHELQRKWRKIWFSNPNPNPLDFLLPFSK